MVPGATWIPPAKKTVDCYISTRQSNHLKTPKGLVHSELKRGIRKPPFYANSTLNQFTFSDLFSRSFSTDKWTRPDNNKKTTLALNGKETLGNVKKTSGKKSMFKWSSKEQKTVVLLAVLSS